MSCKALPKETSTIHLGLDSTEPFSSILKYYGRKASHPEPLVFSKFSSLSPSRGILHSVLSSNPCLPSNSAPISRLRTSRYTIVWIKTSQYVRTVVPTDSAITAGISVIIFDFVLLWIIQGASENVVKNIRREKMYERRCTVTAQPLEVPVIGVNLWLDGKRAMSLFILQICATLLITLLSFGLSGSSRPSYKTIKSRPGYVYDDIYVERTIGSHVVVGNGTLFDNYVRALEDHRFCGDERREYHIHFEMMETIDERLIGDGVFWSEQKRSRCMSTEVAGDRHVAYNKSFFTRRKYRGCFKTPGPMVDIEVVKKFTWGNFSTLVYNVKHEFPCAHVADTWLCINTQKRYCVALEETDGKKFLWYLTTYLAGIGQKQLVMDMGYANADNIIANINSSALEVFLDESLSMYYCTLDLLVGSNLAYERFYHPVVKDWEVLDGEVKVTELSMLFILPASLVAAIVVFVVFAAHAAARSGKFKGFNSAVDRGDLYAILAQEDAGSMLRSGVHFSDGMIGMKGTYDVGIGNDSQEPGTFDSYELKGPFGA